MVPDLKKRQCQLIIAVAHMKMEEMKILAEAAPEVAIMVNGHIREAETEPQMINQTAIFISGDRGEYLGQAGLWAKGKAIKSHYKIIPLSEKLGDHPQVAQWLDRFKLRVQELSALAGRFSAQPAPGKPLGFALSPFVGEENCASCHPDQHRQWRKTCQARAFQTLAKQKKTQDPTCHPCHTTGFKEPPSLADILENVQCEACHGPRKGHPENQKKFLRVEERTCRSCHPEERSPNFNFPAYLQKLDALRLNLLLLQRRIDE